MDDHVSGCKEQHKTRMLHYFILLQTVLFHDVQVAYLNKRQSHLKYIFFDLDLGTDLIARTGRSNTCRIFCGFSGMTLPNRIILWMQIKRK